MEAAHRQGVRAGAPSCQGSVFTLLKALRTPHLGVFREVPLHIHERLSHWALVIGLNLQPSLLLGGLRVRLKVPKL